MWHLVDIDAAAAAPVATYVCCSCGACAGREPAEHLLEVILCVRGQRIASPIDTNGSTTRYGIIEFNICRFRLIELHVPIAIRLYLLRQFLTQCDLAKGGAIGWETARRECASAYRASEQVLVKTKINTVQCWVSCDLIGIL